jgi:excinuclease ABC subunit A
MSGLSLLVIWVGAHQIAQSSLQVGDMMAFLQYAMQVVFSFLMMSMMFIFLPRAAVSGKRIDEVLSTEPVIVDPQDPKPFNQDSHGLVEFRNVSFRYPNAEENVLCNISFTARSGETTAILGGTGSGKSTLMVDLLYNILAHDLNRAHTQASDYDRIEGLQYLDKIINIDQSPIGRSPRSNPGTYTGMFDEIRSLFAEMAESKMRGYKAGRFSFNVHGGRCEACQGQGQLRIEMQFLPDIYVPCDVCHGSRFNRETLQVKYKGLSIADVLDTTVEEGIKLFSNIPAILNKLETLNKVGLGYIKIGQPGTTLSGGEAQRVKLAKELSRRATGRTLYVLDEPSVGLHAADVHMLIDVLQHLVDAGNSVLIIEHNLDIIKVADYVIDLGPEGGDRGGELIASGTPREICEVPASYTGQFLREYLKLHDQECK